MRPVAGSQVGSTVTALALGVTNGLFSTNLDFGAVFIGNATWLAISVRSNATGSYTGLTPLQPLLPVPYAIYSVNAGAAITAGTAGSATTATTANNFSGSLSGNVTGTQSATVVASVGGQTAANVASGASAANAAANANTANGIVKRDGSGNFSAGTITANLAGDVTLASNVVSGITISNAVITNSVITNSVYGGNGGGLTNLNASQLASGVIPLAQLPGAVVTTNDAATVNLNGTFTGTLNGNGLGISFLNANSLFIGTVPFGTLARHHQQSTGPGNLATGNKLERWQRRAGQQRRLWHHRHQPVHHQCPHHQLGIWRQRRRLPPISMPRN